MNLNFDILLMLIIAMQLLFGITIVILDGLWYSRKVKHLKTLMNVKS